MTPTIIPYPKIPHKTMAVHGTPSRPSPSRPSPSHPSPSPLRLHQRRVAVKTSIAVTLPSSRPSPSHCAVHCRAVRSPAVHRRHHQAVHRRRVAPSPSRRHQAVHHFSVTVKPAIRSSIAVGSFHRRRVAVTPSIAKPLRSPSPSRPPPIHPSPSHPSPSPLRQPAKPFIAVAVALPSTSRCRHEVHPRRVFWKHKNIKTYISHKQIPGKYWTPSTGTKCKNIPSFAHTFRAKIKQGRLQKGGASTPLRNGLVEGADKGFYFIL
jgi:hypothetical protein